MQEVTSDNSRTRWIPAKIEYAPQLPVSEKAPEIVKLIRDNQVVVVAGDTGSGKTTQLPKICLDAGLGRKGLIGHTQPRRLAAIAVADRIAEELGPIAAQGVGSQIRFDDRSGPDTFLKLMTDGILLAEIQNDPELKKYEVIIIDEAHERSLNIDFLLGYLRELIKRRKDLKLVITSATIDVEKFSEHFDAAPIISVEGRTYPVEVRYKPIASPEEGGRLDDPQSEAIVSAIREILHHDAKNQSSSGDILVFLPSEREIRDTADILRRAKLGNLEVLPLYGRLQHAEQARIFSAHQIRRVVLATNVAETSITVPGINYVIDTGTARISRYNLQSKVQRLPIEPISQASANQRKGRCGRMANGICIRLYSEQDFESRPEFTDPEILRTNLAAVILRMLYLKLGRVDSFPFLDMPETKAINEGHKLLLELNAITTERRLTSIGRQMAVLPIDPKYSRMIIEANKLGALRDVLVIVSGLSIQDPRESGTQNKQLAAEKHSVYKHPDSDFMSLVLLWESYEKQRQELSQSSLRKYCKKQFLSFMRMREWREVHRQLLLSCQRLRFRSLQGESDYKAVHKSLLSGSLNQIARKSDDRSYLGTRNKKLTLFGSSVLSRSSAKWIVTGDQIETSQIFATQAAKIQPDWVVDVALHLVKRELFDPHWSRKRQEIMAYEKVHLLGLTLVERALVRYAPLDPVGARALFIRHGLVTGEAARDLDFSKKNRDLIAQLEKLEDKIRRPDFLLSEQQQIDFFERILPADVNSTRALKNWLAKQGDRHGSMLTLSESDVLDSSRLQDSLHDFPDAAAIHSNALKIDYVFDPGQERDGATIDVPIALLAQITPADIDWAVPGILKEKCIALIKGLPKSQRKNFIPVSGFVEQLMPLMVAGAGDLFDTLCLAIRKLKGISIDRSAFESVELLPHLRIKLRVCDSSGREVGLDYSLTQLQRKFSDSLSVSLNAPKSQSLSSDEKGAHPVERTGLTAMPSQSLPVSMEVGDGAIKLQRYPCLVDDGDSVSVQLSASQYEAERSHARGVLKLLMLHSVQQKNALRKQFGRFVKTHALKIPPAVDEFIEQAVSACYKEAASGEEGSVRAEVDFDKLLMAVKPRLMVNGDKLAMLLERLLVMRLTLKRQLGELRSAPKYLLQDVDAQLDSLFSPRFLELYGIARLGEFPRYLEAIRLRLSKAPFMGPRDEQDTALIHSYQARLHTIEEHVRQLVVNQRAGNNAELKWMIEEFRVSVFAQNLKAKIPISPQRLEKAFLAAEKGVN